MEAIIKLINKKAQVKDNSYAFKVNKPEVNPMLALTLDDNKNNRPIVKVVSEPFTMQVDTINGLKEFEFVTISYRGSLSVVLNNLDFLLIS